MTKAFAIHPGDILLTEFMEPVGLTAYRLAKELHVSVTRINDLVRGKRAITALRLGIYFGLPAQFWVNLQNEYDLPHGQNRRARQGATPRRVASPYVHNPIGCPTFGTVSPCRRWASGGDITSTTYLFEKSGCTISGAYPQPVDPPISPLFC